MSRILHQTRHLTKVAALSAVILVGSSGYSIASYPFSTRFEDTAKTPIDVSHLNSSPAGSNGYIVVRDGHFTESKTGRRIRFIGVVVTGPDNFPSHSDAETFAARLAKYGVNLARLHWFDNTGSASIWDKSGPARTKLDQEQLEKLDYLIAQLLKHGVYVDINLKVGRSLTAADGMPESTSSLKAVKKLADMFDAKAIELQKQYAKDLLTHTNPYTKRAYTQDPGVLSVEINNENSLLHKWYSGKPTDTPLVDIPEPFAGELKAQWNSWLTRKYGGDKRLTAAWSNTSEASKVASNRGPLAGWNLQQADTAKATSRVDSGAAVVDVTTAGTQAWHVQLMQQGLDLEDGQIYTVSFRAKGTRSASLYGSVEGGDWHGIGLSGYFTSTPEWKSYRYEFTANHTAKGANRIAIALGDNAGEIAVADFTLTKGSTSVQIPPDQTLAAQTVAVPREIVGVQGVDWRCFMSDTETVYALDMRAFLKTNLGVKALVIDSQASFGELAGIYRERHMDYIDDHAYWAHPVFPGNNWKAGWVKNDPSVTTLLSASHLRDMVLNRVAGKPFSISEYNHPAPNEYEAECVPLIASLAAFQDWDTIILHEYGRYGADNPTGYPTDYFNIGSNIAKWAFLPSAAMIFRASEIGPASDEVVVPLPTFEKALSTNFTRRLPRPADILERRISVGMPDMPTVSAKLPAGTRLQLIDPESPRAVYTADSPQAKAILGFTAGRTITLGDVTAVFGDSPHGFAAATLVSLDGRALNIAKSALLTVMSTRSNTGEKFAADKRQVIDWGTGPQMVDGPDVHLTLKSDGPRRVLLLDETGASRGAAKSSYKDGVLTIDISPADATPWYLITGPR
ncbi:MAG TPA: carbohydrate binding domain-containing protein [Capsulimonadaceae bacterium]|jgi:hypothetical protein